MTPLLSASRSLFMLIASPRACSKPGTSRTGVGGIKDMAADDSTCPIDILGSACEHRHSGEHWSMRWLATINRRRRIDRHLVLEARERSRAETGGREEHGTC